jgi:hypothetical protein
MSPDSADGIMHMALCHEFTPGVRFVTLSSSWRTHLGPSQDFTCTEDFEMPLAGLLVTCSQQILRPLPDLHKAIDRCRDMPVVHVPRARVSHVHACMAWPYKAARRRAMHNSTCTASMAVPAQPHSELYAAQVHMQYTNQLLRTTPRHCAGKVHCELVPVAGQCTHCVKHPPGGSQGCVLFVHLPSDTAAA